MQAKTRVLFVCLGNIVRSPLAESMFRHFAERAGQGERFEVDSAGTGGWHTGELPDARMRQVAANRGFTYSGRARKFAAGDYDRFDWIIAMDESNRSDLRALARNEPERDRVRLMREFDPEAGPDASVPDPYYGGIDGFEYVYDIVERSCRGLLEAIQNGDLGDAG
jgi:protein-tyrosine phosphatase